MKIQKRNLTSITTNYEVSWLIAMSRFGLVWFGGFYGISTFVGYLMPNPFLCE